MHQPRCEMPLEYCLKRLGSSLSSRPDTSGCCRAASSTMDSLRRSSTCSTTACQHPLPEQPLEPVRTSSKFHSTPSSCSLSSGVSMSAQRPALMIRSATLWCAAGGTVRQGWQPEPPDGSAAGRAPQLPPPLPLPAPKRAQRHVSCVQCGRVAAAFSCISLSVQGLLPSDARPMIVLL